MRSGVGVVVVGAGGISNAWFPPLKAENVEVVGVVDMRPEAAEAQMRLAMAGRRFSIGEPGDRRGAKPSRPDIAAGLGRSSMA